MNNTFETVEYWCYRLFGNKTNLVLDIILIAVSIMGLISVVVCGGDSLKWFSDEVAMRVDAVVGWIANCIRCIRNSLG